MRGGPDLGDDDVAVEAAVELWAVSLLPHEAVLLSVVQPVTSPTCKDLTSDESIDLDYPRPFAQVTAGMAD